MKVIKYIRPYGTTREIWIDGIGPSIEEFFTSNNIGVSCESIHGEDAFYFDYGKRDEEGEPIELIMFPTRDETAGMFFLRAKLELEGILNEP